jgi:predicted chitinase
MRAALLLLPLIFAVASSMSLSLHQLEQIMPSASKDRLTHFLPYLNDAMAWGGINTCRRISAFLGQIAEESGSLRYMEEIASGKEYEGRCKDLGNCHPGDGVRYKGRGPIQITGRHNYEAAGKGIGHNIVDHPTDAALPQYAFKTAVWYWNSRGLNAEADKGTQAGFDQCTLRVNGCLKCTYTHAEVRNAFWRKSKAVLGC